MACFRYFEYCSNYLCVRKDHAAFQRQYKSAAFYFLTRYIQDTGGTENVLHGRKTGVQ